MGAIFGTIFLYFAAFVIIVPIGIVATVAYLAFITFDPKLPFVGDSVDRAIRKDAEEYRVVMWRTQDLFNPRYDKPPRDWFPEGWDSHIENLKLIYGKK